ncbi:MAG: hypothetical protein O7B99_14185 [Planctomycetota bacterium]|nr:hypothetical protein [Planctomycetota bacterium]
MQRSILVDEHEARGAQLASRPEAPDLPAALTYGDVPAEYRAAREGCIVLDDTDRGAVRVGGSEAEVFLHRLLANDARGLEPGGGNRNLLLSSKGKVQHDFDLFREPDGFSISAAPGDGAKLLTGLDLYLFTEDVQLEDTGAASAPISLCGPAALRIAQAVVGGRLDLADYGGGGHAWEERAFDGAPVRVSSLPVAGSAGVRLDPGPAKATDLWRALIEAGASPAGVAVRDILRVEAGAALFGVDINDEIYPQEARLEAAFSLDKGCYIGQEIVAKIDTYGGLNKRLTPLRVANDDPVAGGTRLLKEEDGEVRDLGVVTSWAYSFVLDTGLVLAYVKRRHQEPGTTFSLGENGPEGTIVRLPVREDAVGA